MEIGFAVEMGFAHYSTEDTTSTRPSHDLVLEDVSNTKSTGNVATNTPDRPTQGKENGPVVRPSEDALADMFPTYFTN